LLHKTGDEREKQPFSHPLGEVRLKASESLPLFKGGIL